MAEPIPRMIWWGQLWLHFQRIATFPLLLLAKYVGYGLDAMPLGNQNGALRSGKYERERPEKETKKSTDCLVSEAQGILDLSQNSQQFLQLQIEEEEEEFGQKQIGQMEVEQWREAELKEGSRVEEYEQLLEVANSRIDELLKREEANQRRIEELHEKLSREEEKGNGRLLELEEEEQQQQLEALRSEMSKLEQKLMNANEEKEYYKKHFREEHQNENGRGGGNSADDFGKELLLANKRKYQLENRVKQMEMELKEAQQRIAHLGESLRSTEKLLWLEKERSATLEMEREQLNGEVAELRRNGEALKRELEALRGEGGPMPSRDEREEEMNRIRAECDQKVNELREMKCKVEWRLGEVTQIFHDTKWRLGEVESSLAHRDWQLEEANNRVKQLESSLGENDSAKISEELNRLRAELAQKEEEKSAMEWRLGEVSQWWNDAKWRVGELEAETVQRSQLLDKAHHRIGELERRLEGNVSQPGLLSHEKAEWERRITHLEKAYNDSQWRVGELKAELARIEGEREQLASALEQCRDQKSKVEWRLGEVSQWWKDAKRRLAELEENGLQHSEGHKQNEAERRIAELETLNGRLSSLLSGGTLLIRKQPHVDRNKWNLLSLENSLDSPLRRVWFEADCANGELVFLVGSFLNWECALLCEPISGRPSRCGIWVDLPRGRHEFCFIRGGQWFTAKDIAECWNEHGTKNNWFNVE